MECLRSLKGQNCEVSEEFERAEFWSVCVDIRNHILLKHDVFLINIDFFCCNIIYM